MHEGLWSVHYRLKSEIDWSDPLSYFCSVIPLRGGDFPISIMVSRIIMPEIGDCLRIVLDFIR